MRRLLCALTFLCLCVPALAQTTVTVSASNVQQDASGTKLVAGYAHFLPVNCATGQPNGFANGGQNGGGEVVLSVTNGAFTGTVVDALAANICYRFTATDISGAVVIGPKFYGAKATGYEFIQPTQNSPANNPWCAAGVCNFDNYIPVMSPAQLGSFEHLTGNPANNPALVAYVATHGGGSGTGINWRGTFLAAPPSPVVGDAYRNSSAGIDYIYTLTGWQEMVQDGAPGATGATGAQGPQGPAGATGAQGPQGIQGTTGPQGSQGNTGPSGGSTNPRGVWNSSNSYVASTFDTVTYQGSLFLAIVNNTNQAPCSVNPCVQASVNTNYWQTIALAGATGAQGVQGTAGATGPAGDIPGCTPDGSNGITCTGAGNFTTVAAGTTTPTSIDDTGVTFPDGSKQATKAGGTAVWTRQPSPIISPQTGDPDFPAGHPQEGSWVINTSPELAAYSAFTQVVEWSFTNGWWPTGGGGTGMSVCFAEGSDPKITPTRYPNCIANHARSFLTKDPSSGNYLLYATAVLTGHLDLYVASTITALSALGSPTYADILDCGSNGSESAGTLGNTTSLPTGGTPAWLLGYECLSHGNWTTWLATGANYHTFAKYQTSPVMGDTGPNASGNCATAAGPQFRMRANGTLDALTTCGPTETGGIGPTHWIYHWTDTTGTGHNWVPDSTPMFTARTPQEGENQVNGQIADAHMGQWSATESDVAFTEYTNGCGGLTTCAYPSYIEVATINQPLDAVMGETPTDAPAQSVPSVTVAPGGGLNYNDATISTTMAANNAYVADCGSSQCVFTLPTTAALGSEFRVVGKGSGGWSINPQSGQTINYGSVAFTAAIKNTNTYDSVTLDVTAANTGFTVVGNYGTLGAAYQDYATFTGPPGTLSAYTDNAGNTFTQYTSDGATPQAMPTLTGSGAVTLTTGGGTTYGDVLSTLMPLTANYIVSLTCTYTASGGNMGIFGRANTSNSNSYLVGVNPGASTAVLYGAGFSALSSQSFTWALNATHTIGLKMNGTSITMLLDGMPYTVINSSVSIVGQAAFRVTQGMSCTNLTVQ